MNQTIREIKGDEKILVLYSHCIIVKGYFRSLIYDLHFKKTYPFFTNKINCIVNNRFFLLSDLFTDNAMIYNTIVKNDLGFIIEYKSLNLFPELNLNYKIYSEYNCINIEFSEFNFNKIEDILNIILEYNVYYIKIIITKKLNFDKLVDFIKKINSTHVSSIDVESNFKLSKTYLKQLNSISFTRVYEQIGTYNMFHLNQEFFIESHSYNTFFNKKLFINKRFEFSNNKVDFTKNITDENKEVWSSSKDKTKICKDCEFRYMCHDTRVPNLNINFEYYHTSYCDYNPYIARFKKDKGFNPVSDFDSKLDSNGFDLDKEKLHMVLLNLWDK